MASLKTVSPMPEESRRLYSRHSSFTLAGGASGLTSTSLPSSGSKIWQTSPGSSAASGGVWGPPSNVPVGLPPIAAPNTSAPSFAPVPSILSVPLTSSTSAVPAVPAMSNSANLGNGSSLSRSPPLNSLSSTAASVTRPLSRESISSLASSTSSSSTLNSNVFKQPLSQPASRTTSVSSTINGSSKDDEIIPTAIVVKNIPFAIKKEQLIEFMTQLGLPLPYAFNYHFDNGVFRGLAFANFTTAEETASVLSSLNGREIGGRKLRVEYKKMLPSQERERIEREKRGRRGQLEEQHTAGATYTGIPSASATSPSLAEAGAAGVAGSPGTLTDLGTISPSATVPSSPLQPSLAAHKTYSGSSSVSLATSYIDMNDPETLRIYSSLLLFRNDAANSEIILNSLNFQRQQVNILMGICAQLDLSCQSLENEFVISKKNASPTRDPTQAYMTGLFDTARLVPAMSAGSLNSKAVPNDSNMVANLTLGSEPIGSSAPSTVASTPIGGAASVSSNQNPWAPRLSNPVKAALQPDLNDKTI